MADININNTSYNVTEDWLKIAAKYFNIDQTSEQSINMLKAGLFGYNNEIQSNEIKNNVYHRNILYDEHFINTASFPESINNFAKLYDIPLNTATPAHMNAILTINKNDIINNQYLETEEVETELGLRYKNNKLILNNDYIFNIEDIQFRLPYPIRFDIRYEGGKPNIIARYDFNNENIFPYMEKTNPYLKTWIQTFDSLDIDDEFVSIAIDLYQLTCTTSTVSVTSNDIIDNLYINKDFKNQLAFVEVYYTENGVKTKLKVTSNDKIVAKDTVYLTIVDDNTFQIYFSSNIRGFRPSVGGEFNIKYYTTLGSNGNFSYSGSIRANFNNNGEFDKIPIDIIPSTDSTGGKDILSIDDIKNKVIEAALTRKNYITDKDLEYYFNNFNTNNSINGSRISFMKKRNDLLKRSFSGYLLLKDQEEKVIPTNTAREIYIPNNFSKTERVNVDGTTESYYRDIINEGDSVIADNDKRNIKFYIYNKGEIFTDGSKFFLFEDINGWSWYYKLGKVRESDTIAVPMVVRTIYSNNIELHNGDITSGTIEVLYYYDYYDVDKESFQKIYITNIEYFIDDDGNKVLCKGVDDEFINKEIRNLRAYTQFNEYQILSYMGGIAVADMGIRSQEADTFDNDGLIVYHNPENNTNDTFNIDTKLFEYGRFTEYAVPYTIKLIRNKQPLKSRYYSMTTNNTYVLNTNYVNTAITNKFVITYLSVVKEFQSYTYNFQLELNTNIENNDIDNVIEIRSIIYNKNKIPMGFIKFNRIEDSFVYEASISSNLDELNEYDKLLVSGTYSLDENPDILDSYESNNGAEIQVSRSNGTDMWIEDQIYMSIAVFFKNDIDNFKYGDYVGMVGGSSESDKRFENSTTAIIYDVTNPVRMFRRLEDYMESDFIQIDSRNYNEKLEVSTNNGTSIPLLEMEYDYFKLKDVPLVEYNYYNAYYSYVNNLTDNYYVMVENMLELLENNNTMNIKFYNTYGPSNTWKKINIQTGMDEPIDNMAIKLNFIIYTNKVVSDREDLTIKSFISRFVESCNSNKVFAMSNLLRALENNFDYILYVEFGKMDGDEIQKIYNTDKERWNMTKQDIIDYVPEYLNIEKHVGVMNENIEYGGDDYFVYHIYEYDINIEYR